jgi:hypothetical protein
MTVGGCFGLSRSLAPKSSGLLVVSVSGFVGFTFDPGLPRIPVSVSARVPIDFEPSGDLPGET